MKRESDEWQAEAGGKKIKVRSRTDWVSYRVARLDVGPLVTERLSLKPGTKINLTSPTGNVYFVTATKPQKVL